MLLLSQIYTFSLFQLFEVTMDVIVPEAIVNFCMDYYGASYEKVHFQLYMCRHSVLIQLYSLTLNRQKTYACNANSAALDSESEDEGFQQ